MAYQLVGTVAGERRILTLHSGPNRVGRASSHAEFVLHSETVSRLHAEIDVDDVRVEIRDLDSHNGTFVNGDRVERQFIRPGDVVRFGDVELTLQQERTAAAGGANAFTSGESTPPVHAVWESDRSTPKFRPDSHLDSARLFWSRPETGSRDVEEGSGFLTALVELGQFLVRDEPGQDVFASCLERVADLFSFRLACLLEMNEAGETEVRCHYPVDLAPELEVSRCMVDAVVRERKALLVRDVAAEAPLWDSAVRKGIRSAIVAPLLQNTEVLGVLYLDHKDPRRSFERRHLKRLQLLANLVAAKIASARTRHDIQLAAYIQRSLLGSEPRHPAGYEAAFRLEPSELVGGDLYETLELPEGRYLYALGDIVGHGMGAALLMSNVLATLRALARTAQSPLQLAKELQETLNAQLEPHGFVTLFLGFLDPGTHRLEYVNAGHEPPALLVPGSALQPLESTGPPLGMPIPVPLHAASAELPPGTVLCAWSDGIPESIRIGTRPPEEFTRERMLERLDELRGEPAAAIVARIFSEVDAFVGSKQALDDRTMLVLRRVT